MSFWKIIVLSIGLAMDAFGVSICQGISMKKIDVKKGIIIALYFGIFQAGMPVIGYLLGVSFKDAVSSIDHWIAFILLASIGANMVRESIKSKKAEDVEKREEKSDTKTLLILALATSIDALAVGITFAFLKVNLALSVSTIGIITFIISLVGVIIGNKFGNKYQNKAEIAGGVVLILLGLKILIEHLTA